MSRFVKINAGFRQVYCHFIALLLISMSREGWRREGQVRASDEKGIGVYSVGKAAEACRAVNDAQSKSVRSTV